VALGEVDCEGGRTRRVGDGGGFAVGKGKGDAFFVGFGELLRLHFDAPN
jgi:hypothetical protein